MPAVFRAKSAKRVGPKSAKALEKEYMARRAMQQRSGKAHGYNPYRDAHGRFAPGPHKARGTSRHAAAAVGAFTRARKLAAARAPVRAAAAPAVKAHEKARAKIEHAKRVKDPFYIKSLAEAKPEKVAKIAKRKGKKEGEPEKMVAAVTAARRKAQAKSVAEVKSIREKQQKLSAERKAKAGPKNVHFSPKVDEAFKSEVNKAINEMPKSVVGRLEKAGYNIYAVHSITDAKPDWKGKRPRGYPKGATWDHVDGIHVAGEKEIIVAQMKTEFGSNKTVRTNRAVAVLFHETGHGLDHVLGDVSAHSDFREVYQKDVKSIPEGVHKRLSYYLQEGDVGPREAFAETFAQHYGRLTSANYILTYFPNTHRYVEGLLK